ncbi:MAG TPA: hypothetical protein VFI37_09700 [Gaiellaceae bacterium]|nr:hypothetical protein [Gaiellaceae bacterium]
MNGLRLFDLVALGGTLATRARFSIRILTGEFEVPPRALLLVTHRSDWDIPLTTNVYWRARLWRGVRPVFVARDDMFLRGFLAGYPPGLPLPLRGALAPVRVGGVLREQGLALPIASAGRAHLADVVRDDPSRPLDELPDEVAAALRARARRLGRPEPRVAAEVDDGVYLDLLWRRFERAELPGLDAFWGRRQGVARRDFEALLEHVAAGGSLAIYPEGRPSPDGSIGPVQRGLGLLIRRARPEVLQPVALAYDPLGPGRTRAYIAVGAPFAPPARGAEAEVLAAFRALLPLTPGQVAAHAAVQGIDPELVAARALDERRPGSAPSTI